MSFNPDSASLAQWLERLEQLHPTEIDLGLIRVKQVAERLGCLKPAPLTIVVGGTNGKGTTSAFLVAMLRAQGLKVGAYNSPHIHRYNERISINGTEASNADICQVFGRIEAQRQDISLTYFEFGTLAALCHFQQEQVDACVLEVGLGGRLDAVNIVDADISIVTSIGLDHQSYLGDTLELIAYEKCSIARKDKWLVCGQSNPPTTAKETVANLGGKFCQRDQDFFIEATDTGFDLRFKYESKEQRWSLPPAHIPHHNIASAIQALALVEQLPSQAEVVKVLTDLRVAGRLQSFQRGELTLTLDVAHNEQAAAYIGEKLKQVDGIVLGMLSDKEPAKVVKVLPTTSQWILLSLDCPRGLNAEQLAEKTQLTALTTEFVCLHSIEEVFKKLPTQGHWLICGSFYTVDAALQIIAQENTWLPI